MPRTSPWRTGAGGLEKLRPWFILNRSERAWWLGVLALALLGLCVRGWRLHRRIPRPVPPAEAALRSDGPSGGAER